jgi:hypothetical protein
LPAEAAQVEPAKLGEGIEVGRPAELDADPVPALEHLAVKRGEPLGEGGVPGGLDRGPALGVPFVRLGDRRRPVGHRLPIDLDLEGRLELRQPCLLGPGGRPEVALERELMEVAEPATELAGRRPADLPDPLDRLAIEQVSIALIDRLHLELALVAGEMEVVLAVELLDEALGPLAV